MLQPNLEYNPKKKSRVLKIIVQILSTLFTTVMFVALISAATDKQPQYIPFEEVNLYNTNYDDVYELKDLTVVSNYASDEYVDYYLVLLPYNDETVKVASLCCQNSYDFNINIRKQLDNENTKLGDCMVSAGVTADYTDMLYDNIEEDYHKAVENLKDSGMNIVSTELAFDFTCNPDRDSFAEYYASERSDNYFVLAIIAVFSIIGIGLMIISFKNSNDYNQGQTYYVPGSHKTALDYDFDSRF